MIQAVLLLRCISVSCPPLKKQKTKKICADPLSLQTSFFVPVGLKTARKNQTQPVDFGMSFLMSAFHKISTSSLSLSQVRSLKETFSLIFNRHTKWRVLMNAYVDAESEPDVYMILIITPFLCLEISGQCWAHQSCALWSEGVCEGEGQSLLNVDRAIDSGSTKVSQGRTSMD